MTKIDYKVRRSNPTPAGSVKSRNFYNMQRTQVEPDKENFDSWQLLENFIQKGANADVRRGYDNLIAGSDYLDFDIFKEIDGNLLYAFKKNGNDTDVVEVDRSTGAETDVITGITGHNHKDSDSLNGIFYYATGNSSAPVGTYNKQTASTGSVTVETGEICNLLTSDQSRAWGVFKDANSEAEFLRFSDHAVIGAVSTFENPGASTSLTRQGIADSSITKFTAIHGVGRFVVACSANKTEIHAIPEFGLVSQPIFTADMGTLQKTYDNIGVSNKNAITASGDEVFLNPGDGTIVIINLLTGELRVEESNKRQLQEYDHSETALGYDQKKNLLLISVKTNTRNNRVIAYNVRERNFSLFTNIYADRFRQDKDNVYFFNTKLGIYDAFGDTHFTDDGQRIPIKVRTQATNLGSDDVYSLVSRYYLNVLHHETLTGKVRIFADRRINANFNSPSFQADLELSYSSSPYAPYTQSFAGGDWGGAGTDPEFKDGDEKLFTSEFVNIEGVRFEMEFSASVNRPFSLRGIGLYYLPTARPANNLTYQS